MLTVIIGFEGSGKTKNRNPLSNRYSVMPSTEVTFVTPVGKAACALQIVGIAEKQRAIAAMDKTRLIMDLFSLSLGRIKKAPVRDTGA